MRVAIMQPYFLPYIGYFQLIANSDQFVIYDDIQFTKKGWIHRNRYLRNGEAALFTLPLRKDSDYLDVRDRQISESYDANKMLAQIMNAYRKAPEFTKVIPVIDEIFKHQDRNLFRFVQFSLIRICAFLEIETPIIASSSLGDSTMFKGQNRVLAICDAVGATEYVNPIGGTHLYSSFDFRTRGIELQFMRRLDVSYTQFTAPFVPDLSIIDILMFNSVAQSRALISTSFEVMGPGDE